MKRRTTYSLTTKYSVKVFTWESILNKCELPNDYCIRLTITKGIRHFIVTYRYPKKEVKS